MIQLIDNFSSFKFIGSFYFLFKKNQNFAININTNTFSNFDIVDCTKNHDRDYLHISSVPVD